VEDAPPPAGEGIAPAEVPFPIQLTSVVGSAVDLDNEIALYIDEINTGDNPIVAVDALLPIGFGEPMPPQELEKASFEVAVGRRPIAAPPQHNPQRFWASPAALGGCCEVTLQSRHGGDAPTESRLNGKLDDLQIAHRSKIYERSMHGGDRQALNDGDIPRRDILGSVNGRSIRAGTEVSRGQYLGDVKVTSVEVPESPGRSVGKPHSAGSAQAGSHPSGLGRTGRSREPHDSGKHGNPGTDAQQIVDRVVGHSQRLGLGSRYETVLPPGDRLGAPDWC
jgi:hypothetical protein